MMKILFMGSAAFAVPSLIALSDSDHHVVEVVTQPDKPAGRGQHVAPCPVAALAHELNLTVYQPSSVKTPEVIDHCAALDVDLIVVVAYGKILPPAMLTLPRQGCINVHASLLPRYRGAAPIQWAMINGDATTGVTTMYLSEKMDEGDIIRARATPIDSCEMIGDLHDRLAGMGAELLLETIAAIETGKVIRKKQNAAQATYAPPLKKEDGNIPWQLAAAAIYNRFRGLTPWPGTYTHWEGKQLSVWEMAVTPQSTSAAPGTVLKSDHELAIATGDGQIYLLEVQLEGKKRMSTDAFLRGHPLPVGTVLT